MRCLQVGMETKWEWKWRKTMEELTSHQNRCIPRSTLWMIRFPTTSSLQGGKVDTTGAKDTIITTLQSNWCNLIKRSRGQEPCKCLERVFKSKTRSNKVILEFWLFYPLLALIFTWEFNLHHLYYTCIRCTRNYTKNPSYEFLISW